MSLPNPMDNITMPDWTKLNDVNFTEVMDRGLLWQGFSPYIVVFGDFWWGLLLGVMAIAIYNTKKNVYGTIGFLMAMLLITAAILPVGWVDFLAIILGLSISGLLYRVFATKKKQKEEKRR